MKVIEIPFCFYPDPVGGTEIYVEALSLGLQGQGVEVVVAAPAEGISKGTYLHNGLVVRRFPVSKVVDDLGELYGGGNREAAAAFGAILDEEKVDIVHLHAFTRACSLRLVREARKRGIPVLFTYHTPTVSCQRGTLMRWGSEVCDGLLDIHACASCYLQSLGLGKLGSLALGHLPSGIGDVLAGVGLSGGFWTAFRMSQLIALHHAAFRDLMEEVQHVVAVCDWVRELLLRNGVPTQKITVSRHGVCSGISKFAADCQFQTSSNLPLRIAFLGRIDMTKGPDILIRALVSMPDVPVQLHIYGIVQGGASAGYLQQLKTFAKDDPRISFHSAVQSGEVIQTLQGVDVLAVPSRVLETGPMVVLEGFAAGIPVVGSRLGGIAELVEDGVNGLLVDSLSVDAWKEALRRVVEDRGLLAHLRAGVRPPKRMEAVALEMKTLYESLC